MIKKQKSTKDAHKKKAKGTKHVFVLMDESGSMQGLEVAVTFHHRNAATQQGTRQGRARRVRSRHERVVLGSRVAAG
jgi:hypothetical protein